MNLRSQHEIVPLIVLKKSLIQILNYPMEREQIGF
jgi:hypothetical protein